jgi:transcriptional regulator with XRE-family HTH domain
MPRTIFSEPYVALTKALIAARGKAGLLQEEVATRLKKPQSFVSKVERGERRLDVIEFIVFSKAIEADPVEIVRTISKQVRDDQLI